MDGDWQGRGLGRALMAEVETRAVRYGCVRLHGAMSLNAVPFYAAVGFLPCHGPQYLVTARTLVPVVRMEKELAREWRRR